MSRAITIDFHNTLASCDAWFELEVRHLPAAFLRWEAERRGSELAAATADAATETYRALRREISGHGEELTAEGCVAAVLERMGIPVDRSSIIDGVEVLMRASFVDVSPLPGAIDLLVELGQSGLPLAIVSNAVYHPFLEWTLDHFNIRDAFMTVSTSASMGLYKSRPEIYVRTLERVGATPSRSIHIGDSLRWDVDSAKQAGMGTVWLRHGNVESRDVTPDLTIDSLAGSSKSILTLSGLRSVAVRADD